MSELRIQSQAYPYVVSFHDTLASITAPLKADPKHFFLIDANVRRLYPDAFDGISESRLLGFEATEENKSYEALTPRFVELIRQGFKKDSHLFAIGGGITQDAASFMASNLYRGVAWSLIPTTLLAQADSCIGGKNSINVAGYKNLIGNFYAPRRVLISTDVLRTLSDDDIRSGLGEVIKILYIDGQAPEALTHIPRDADALRKDQALARRLVQDCLRVKKRFIEEDEFDRGIRNLLNFGHTFGHAFESATHYGIPHGIAVTLGMTAAAYFAEKLGQASAGSYVVTRDFLAPFYLPFDAKLRALGIDALMGAMRLDKKNTAGGKITFILARGPGQLDKTPLESDRARALLEDWLRTL